MESYFILHPSYLLSTPVTLTTVSFLLFVWQTWISNRRRKYRLMGIEIPPPKGGPAVFTNSSPGSESPDDERLRTPEFEDDLNDGGSVCLSEGEATDTTHSQNTHICMCISVLSQCSLLQMAPSTRNIETKMEQI